jgi:methyl-accepting chemotaxis protein
MPGGSCAIRASLCTTAWDDETGRSIDKGDATAMNWFTNLKTAPRLLIGFGFIVALLGAAIVTGYRGMAGIREQAEIVTMLGEVEGNQHETRALLMTMLSSTDRAALANGREEISAVAQRSDELLRRLELAARSEPALAARVRELVQLRDEHRRVREQQVLAPLAEGRVDAARATALGPQMETYTRLRRLLATLAADTQREAESAWLQARQLLAGTAIAALALALLIVVALTRITAAPLRDLAVVADRIAEGDLDVALPPGRRGDEIGALTDAFARMVSSLRVLAEAARRIAAQDLTVDVRPQSARDELGQSLSTMVSNLRTSTASLAASVSALGASASEILAATTQVASGAAETGTAIAQTTTTVEEVRQTAQLASQKARQVSEGAQKASQVGQAGRQSVDATIEGMRHIRAQMEAIAETVVRLSEHSQAIGEIIAAVNDLAEQSNLLAVNAAIEAAKAGEQGRGFSVVAQEVRSLAEQSRQATSQVRGILHEIQKATTAAVLATEQGSKAVEAGVRQSTEAGDAIAQLAGTVGEAAQAATQIAASSQQQLVGTDQVALAMQNIKQASMQNVSATKQAETAAHNLNHIGGTLKEIVAQYRF